MSQIEDTAIFNTVVITGEIKPTESSKSVQNVRIITLKTIERQGAVNLGDLLSKELNVRLSNDNILGTSLSLQGISGQNIKILLDGVPLIGRENGNIDLSQINLSNIERIEMIEGPLSVIYGTDALGGVINLISKKITLDKNSQINANAYTESIGHTNVGAGGIFKFNNANISASLNRNFFSGFSPNSSRVMLWKPKQQVFGSFGIHSDVSKKIRVRFKTDIFSEKIENRGSPVVNHLEAYAFDEYYLTNRNINSLDINFKQNTKTNWNVLSSFGFYQRDKITYRKDLVTLQSDVIPTQEANTSTSFLNFMTRGTYNKTASKIFNYQFGYDINLNSAFGSRILSEKGKINDYAIFSCFEYKPNQFFILKPGFRATYNNRYSAPFVPSIQFQYGRVKNLTIRYAYGRGFRAPSLKELYLDFVDYNHNITGNTNLKAEMSDNHNMSFKYKLKVKKSRIVYIENSYFYNKIYNQIAIVAVNPIALEYTYRNIDFFRSNGANLNVTTQSSKLIFSMGASYTGVNNNAFLQVNQNKFFYTPEVRSQISYMKSFKKLDKTTFSIFYKHNGTLMGYALDDTRNVVSTRIEGFSILDCTINQPFYHKKASLTFGVKNILNVTTIQATGNTTVHSGGSNSMPISVGRSGFIQLNVKI
ncbi:MAG: TonB-dependent receptor [Bacteroidota bacterium]|nr:TonB-dependent receptor [Bacteroidota bacterium]